MINHLMPPFLPSFHPCQYFGITCPLFCHPRAIYPTSLYAAISQPRFLPSPVKYILISCQIYSVILCFLLPSICYPPA
jgi:hypothetical protein